MTALTFLLTKEDVVDTHDGLSLAVSLEDIARIAEQEELTYELFSAMSDRIEKAKHRKFVQDQWNKVWKDAQAIQRLEGGVVGEIAVRLRRERGF